MKKYLRLLFLLSLTIIIVSCQDGATDIHNTEIKPPPEKIQITREIFPTIEQTSESLPTIGNITSVSTITTVFSNILDKLSSGEYFLYTTGNNGLFAYSLESHSSIKVDDKISNFIGISPDHHFIAYTQPYASFVYDIEKGIHYRLDLSKGCSNPQFSSTSEYLLMDCSGEHDGTDLVMYYIPDFSKKVIMDCEIVRDNCKKPLWSPNDEYVLYNISHDYSGEDNETGLYLMNKECVTSTLCNKGQKLLGPVISYSWMPDSDHIVAVQHGKLKLFQLVNHRFILEKELLQIDWGEKLILSPDNSRIAITSQAGDVGIFSIEDGKYELIPMDQYDYVQAWIVIK